MKGRDKTAISCSFLDPPEKPSPCFFLTTPQKKENPFFRQLIKILGYNYNCTSSEKIVLKGKIVLQHLYKLDATPFLNLILDYQEVFCLFAYFPFLICFL